MNAVKYTERGGISVSWLGASLELATQPGHGSTFRVILPCRYDVKQPVSPVSERVGPVAPCRTSAGWTNPRKATEETVQPAHLRTRAVAPGVLPFAVNLNLGSV